MIEAKQREGTPKQIRLTALSFGILFCLFAAIAWYQQHPKAATVWLVIALALNALAWGSPSLMRWPYRGWIFMLSILAWLNTRLLLGLVLLLVFTPSRIILTLLRKDLLRRRWTNEPTYWIKRPPERPAPQRYESH